ncbi:hypothetical protein RJ639_016188 [Escallonia herrerae]|uniref:Methyltransferase type 11 domain-containing protein n=1 Tax=Escallonia herrerae TaxID=1293975 RepID=A0AA88VGY7_9ASTE|nr:hypothetical protein RJ639_016188 [Escallonia herrerae]
MTEAYGEAWYWDKRYEREAAEGGAPFDWYQKYPSLAPLLRLYVPPHHRVLVVGCGNSAFSEGMVDDGYRDVVNVDISSVVIEAMQKKYSGNPHLKYMRMDVRDMSAFQKGSFNAVVDKGTLDSLLCGHNSRENAAKMLEEVGRYITYGAPNYRLRLMRESRSWTIRLHVIEKLRLEERYERQTRELTSPISLDGCGSSVEKLLGKNSDVHYIYVCIKDDSQVTGLRRESAIEGNAEHELAI